MSNLILYKASAGSGKTFTLTREYILLLFKEPLKFRHILAVTFTNKAANEMKSRIVKELYKLTLDNTKSAPSPVFDFIKMETNLPDRDIQDRAKEALSLILHDYSRFSVGTIDAFFQSVIRSFTREIGVCNNYDIELDDSIILTEAISQMIDGLDENTSLKNWLALFAEEKIEQGKSWNLHKDFTKLGTELFKENLKQHLLSGSGPSFKEMDFTRIKSYIETLKKIRKTYEDTLQSMAKEALQLISRHGLDMDDFKQKSRSFVNTLKKIESRKDFSDVSKIYRAAGDVESWYVEKSASAEKIINVYHLGLNDLMLKMSAYIGSHSVDYHSATLILKNLYTLGILNHLQKQIQEYQSQNDIFLLSDSSYLLRSIIDGCDTPFIFEKTGNNYNHFIIDEFQDTSAFQWDSFKPLIENSMASGYSNYVVGDTKQSIYRWRNSNWKLIAGQVEEEFARRIEPKTLQNNWRSARPLVEFNNSLFEALTKNLMDVFEDQHKEFPDQSIVSKNIGLLQKAYADLKQICPDQNVPQPGYVNVQFFDKKALKLQQDKTYIEESENEEPFENGNHALNKLPEIIRNIQDMGYSARDIAVLVRSKKEGRMVAERLLNCKEEQFKTGNSSYIYDVISSDSLVISNSSAVNFMVAVLQYIIDETDAINLAVLVNEYHQYLNAKGQEIKTTISMLDGISVIKPRLKILAEKAKYLSLYELTESIMTDFDLYQHKSETAYMLAFLDMILDYTKRNGSGIKAFVEWWEEAGNAKTLNLSSDQDAIKILTIHKSKGLEFKAVIVPFCNWAMDYSRNQSIMWCKPDREPFSQLDLVPVTYSSAMLDSIFAKDYIDEKMQQFVDNLNLLYVAFTRARNCLFVMGTIADAKKISNSNISDILFRSLKTNSFELINSIWDDELLNFSYGSIPAGVDKSKTGNQKTIADVEISLKSSNTIQKKLRIRYDYEGMFGTADTKIRKASLDKGKLMHRILAEIKTSKDVTKVVNKSVAEGWIDYDDAGSLIHKIKGLLSKPEIKPWFDESAKVISEKDILLPGNLSRRPDRVVVYGDKAIVIDYKTGHSEKQEYIEQVQDYMYYLKKMNYTVVEGYLWYIELNTLKKV